MEIMLGTIEKIEDVKDPHFNSGFKKKVVDLRMKDDQLIFIEFRTKTMLEALTLINLNEKVVVSVRFEGKVATGSGIRFNNTIAQSIKNYNHEHHD